MNKDIKTWLGCAGYIVVAILIYKSCDWYSTYYNKKEHLAYVEKKRNDSIRKEFIKDSLAHDPHYQDSIIRAEKAFKIWYDSVSAIRDKTIAGVMYNGDSVYHTCFHDSFFIEDCRRLRFVSNKEVDDKQIMWCDVCRNLDVESLLEDGELIHREDAKDYIDDDY